MLACMERERKQVEVVLVPVTLDGKPVARPGKLVWFCVPFVWTVVSRLLERIGLPFYTVCVPLAALAGLLAAKLIMRITRP